MIEVQKESAKDKDMANDIEREKRDKMDAQRDISTLVDKEIYVSRRRKADNSQLSTSIS